MLLPRAIDIRLMEAAARLAASSEGTTLENPNVGAFVTSADDVPQILGRGVTAAGGRPHAEPQALSQAGEAARGGYIYVTLEPCHHYGKTPPCVNSIIRAGIKRAYIGLTDPDPRTSGQSIQKLRAAGIQVIHDVALQTCEKLHRGFVSRLVRKRPFVVVKQGISVDGAIGCVGQGQVAITGLRAKQFTHMMRAHSDAVLVSMRTLKMDHPRLDVRLEGLKDRAPLKVILKRAGKLTHSPTDQFQPMNKLQQSADGRLNILAVKSYKKSDLEQAFHILGDQGINNVFVEPGSFLCRALFDSGMVDEYIALVSDKSIKAKGTPLSAIKDYDDWRIALDKYGFRFIEKSRLGTDTKYIFAPG